MVAVYARKNQFLANTCFIRSVRIVLLERPSIIAPLNRDPLTEVEIKEPLGSIQVKRVMFKS